MAMVGLFLFIAVYNSAPLWDGRSICMVDGTFVVNQNDYSLWGISHFFNIGIGFGNFTFAEAKIIDISWDIVVGRGGQALMAFLSWNVFADYVTTSMEFAPVTFTVFSFIFLQDEPSFLLTLGMIRAFIFNRGLKSKLAMVFMVLTMLFIIAWPTVASAMTGYTTTSQAFVPDTDKNYILLSYFKPLAYVIDNGGRVGLDNTYIPFLANGSEWGKAANYTGGFIQDCNHMDPLLNTTAEVRSAIYKYTALHGFNVSKNTSSIWMDKTIESPTLNITVCSVPGDNAYYDFIYQPNTSFVYSEYIYSLSNITKDGKCQPVEDRFTWGFSCIQLFTALTLLSLGTIGTYILWLKARFQLPLQGELETYKGWRAVMFMGEKMSKAFQDAGIDARSLTDSQLKDKSPTRYIAVD
ncbi:hypothetical protein K445DRAFT_22256 [Daldinia sp. EC12]|nr:hypothetical protein K445DRAFT_22256 [Daldinia sp. EC12]